jgi:hypothetical protein
MRTYFLRTYFSMPYRSMFIEPRGHITLVLLVHSIIIMTTECYCIESSDHHVQGYQKARLRCVAAYSAVHANPSAVSPPSFSLVSPVCVILVLWYDPSIVQTLFKPHFPYRHLSTFVPNATTSCIPKPSNNVEPWSTRAASVQTSTRPWTAVWYIGTIF